MAPHWSYDVTKFADPTAGYYSPSTIGERYQVRLLIHDTNSARQLFQDEEIDWQITREANVYTVGALLCDVLVTRANGIKSKKVGDLSITYDIDFYRSLSAQLRARGYSNQIPYAGGISVSDKSIQEQDTDATKPSVFRRLDDNPGAPAVARPPTNPLDGTGY